MSITAPDPALRDSYERIALVSHPRHLDQLGAPDRSTLVIATEWLTWWEAKNKGYHVTHYESRLAPWPDEIGRFEDIYLKACEWIYVDGKDATQYKGVSLGQAFGTAATLAWMAATRLDFAINKICSEVRPSEMILFDLIGMFLLKFINGIIYRRDGGALWISCRGGALIVQEVDIRANAMLEAENRLHTPAKHIDAVQSFEAGYDTIGIVRNGGER